MVLTWLVLNGPQLLPHIPRTIGAHLGPRPSPAPANHNRKTRLKNADFDFDNPQETKLAVRVFPYAPQLYARLPRTTGAHLGPHSPCPSPAPTNPNRKTGSKNADFDFENPQQTKLGARAVPNAPQLYSRLLRTIAEHLGRGSPGTWDELNFRSDFLRPPWDATI
jgi:hypothetical protein